MEHSQPDAAKPPVAEKEPASPEKDNESNNDIPSKKRKIDVKEINLPPEDEKIFENLMKKNVTRETVETMKNASKEMMLMGLGQMKDGNALVDNPSMHMNEMHDPIISEIYRVLQTSHKYMPGIALLNDQDMQNGMFVVHNRSFQNNAKVFAPNSQKACTVPYFSMFFRDNTELPDYCWNLHKIYIEHDPSYVVENEMVTRNQEKSKFLPMGIFHDQETIDYVPDKGYPFWIMVDSLTLIALDNLLCTFICTETNIFCKPEHRNLLGVLVHRPQKDLEEEAWKTICRSFLKFCSAVRICYQNYTSYIVECKEAQDNPLDEFEKFLGEVLEKKEEHNASDLYRNMSAALEKLADGNQVDMSDNSYGLHTLYLEDQLQMLQEEGEGACKVGYDRDQEDEYYRKRAQHIRQVLEEDRKLTPEQRQEKNKERAMKTNIAAAILMDRQRKYEHAFKSLKERKEYLRLTRCSSLVPNSMDPTCNKKTEVGLPLAGAVCDDGITRNEKIVELCQDFSRQVEVFLDECDGDDEKDYSEKAMALAEKCQELAKVKDHAAQNIDPKLLEIVKEICKPITEKEIEERCVKEEENQRIITLCNQRKEKEVILAQHLYSIERLQTLAHAFEKNDALEISTGDRKGVYTKQEWEKEMLHLKNMYIKAHADMTKFLISVDKDDMKKIEILANLQNQDAAKMERERQDLYEKQLDLDRKQAAQKKKCEDEKWIGTLKRRVEFLEKVQQQVDVAQKKKMPKHNPEKFARLLIILKNIYEEVGNIMFDSIEDEEKCKKFVKETGKKKLKTIADESQFLLQKHKDELIHFEKERIVNKFTSNLAKHLENVAFECASIHSEETDSDSTQPAEEDEEQALAESRARNEMQTYMDAEDIDTVIDKIKKGTYATRDAVAYAKEKMNYDALDVALEDDTNDKIRKFLQQ